MDDPLIAGHSMAAVIALPDIFHLFEICIVSLEIIDCEFWPELDNQFIESNDK